MIEITAPTRAELRELARASRPALIRGLFETSPIRRVDSAESARRELGRLSIEVEHSDEQFLEGVATGVRLSSTVQLAAYLEPRPGQAATRCFAQPTPAAARAMFHFDDPSADPSDTTSLLFLAREGQSSHLHFDDDQRDVLLYQVFGKKRFVVIHPRETAKVAPFVSPLGFTTSGVYLENMTRDDRAAYLRWTHASEIVLEPGSTLFIPRMYWHYADYDQTAMSITFRLGRTEIVRRFAEATPLPGVAVQALAMELTDHDRVSSGDRALLAEELRAVLEAAPQKRIAGIAQEHALRTLVARWLARSPRADHVADLQYRETVPTPRCLPRSASTDWVRDARPLLTSALVTAMQATGGSSLWLMHDHRLIAELTISEAWVRDLLLRVARANGSVTVGELADQVPIDDVVDVLRELEERGWLLKVEAG